MQKYENMNSVLLPAKMDKKTPLDFKGSYASVVLITKQLIINDSRHYHKFSEDDLIQVV